jgi:hypothetical protein
MGYVAKLTADKTKILNIYLDKKTASLENGYKIGAIDFIVKSERPSNGSSYMLYKNCKDEIRDSFLRENGNRPPLFYKDGVGKFDISGNLVTEFVCKYDAIRKNKMSDKTLRRAITENIPFDGYYYRMIGSKVKYF